MSKIITLTKGKETIVDDEDFEELSKHKWHCSHGYAARSYWCAPYKHKTIFMHREIMCVPPEMDTDHINGNELDNRRENLRICVHAENRRNSKKNANNISGYKGVSWSKGHEKWKAVIKISYKQEHLGYFKNVLDAARAYDKAAKNIFGEFARTNFND
jgi:hypothetical protein